MTDRTELSTLIHEAEAAASILARAAQLVAQVERGEKTTLVLSTVAAQIEDARRLIQGGARRGRAVLGD